MAAMSRRETTDRSRKTTVVLFVAACISLLVNLSLPVRTCAQSLAEWNQIKAKCGLPAGTIYNTWVAQGAPCSQGGSASTAANAQQQLATQVTTAAAQRIGEELHDALFGKPETPEQQQLRIAAKQLNNSGVWYMAQGKYEDAIVEFEKALQKTANNATILGNLTLARRMLQESSRNTAAASQNSNALANVFASTPAAARPTAWDKPESVFQNIDVNFSSNTVNLQDAAPAVDPANLKKDDPASGHPLQINETVSHAFDKAVETAPQTPNERDQLNSEFDNLVAPASGAQANPQPAPAAVKKSKAQAASNNSQKPAEKP